VRAGAERLPCAGRGPGLAQLSTVISDTQEAIIASDPAVCTEAPLGCPCGGDPAVHAARFATVAGAPAATVECPECGEPSSLKPVATWGHCRACRTADSRSIQPLRW
jgi:hypothetical protein